jgi:tryptophan-rich sensory protein
MTWKRSVLIDIGAMIGFLLLSFSAAAIGGAATIPNLSPWYAELRKPAWIPPSSLFGPVWTVLYVMISLAAWLVWKRRREHPEAVQLALGCFLLQLGLNAAWSWMFFGLHRTGLAFAEILSLWLMIAATTLTFVKVSRTASWLMVPYLLWVTFAVVLNGAIHRLN